MKESEFKGGRILMRDDPIIKMTVRDYYAGQVLNALLGRDTTLSTEFMVAKSFDLADIMLEARENFE